MFVITTPMDLSSLIFFVRTESFNNIFDYLLRIHLIVIFSDEILHGFPLGPGSYMGGRWEAAEHYPWTQSTAAQTERVST